MKNNKNIFFYIYKNTLRILMVFFPIILLAKTEYIPMEQDIGIGVDLNTNNLGSLIGEIYNLGIAITVVLAILVIMYAGIQYMITDNSGKKGDSIEKIKGALLGLGLALASYLILNTINPQILDLDKNKLINPNK